MLENEINLSLGKTYIGTIIKKISDNLYSLYINKNKLTSYSSIPFQANEKIFVTVTKIRPKYTLKLIRTLSLNNTDEMISFVEFCSNLKISVSLFNEWLWINYFKKSKVPISKKDIEKLTLLAKNIPEKHNIPFEIYINFLKDNPDSFEEILNSLSEIFQNKDFSKITPFYHKLFNQIDNLPQKKTLSKKYGDVSYQYLILKEKKSSIYVGIKSIKDKNSFVYSIQLFHPLSEFAKLIADIRVIDNNNYLDFTIEDNHLNENYQFLLENITHLKIKKITTHKAPIITFYEEKIRKIN